MLLFSHLLILSFHQFLFFLLLPLFLYQLLLCQKALHRRTLLCYFHLKILFFLLSSLFFLHHPFFDLFLFNFFFFLFLFVTSSLSLFLLLYLLVPFLFLQTPLP